MLAALTAVGEYIIGTISEKTKEITVKNIFITCIIGLVAVYVFGLIHMYIIINFYLRQAYSVWKVFSIGFFSVYGGRFDFNVINFTCRG